MKSCISLLDAIGNLIIICVIIFVDVTAPYKHEICVVERAQFTSGKAKRMLFNLRLSSTAAESRGIEIAIRTGKKVSV